MSEPNIKSTADMAKSVADSQKRDEVNGLGLSSSLMKDPNPQKALTTYTVADIIQGVPLYKPPGASYDIFNQELSKELENLKTEKLYTEDKRLNPFDVFVGDKTSKPFKGTLGTPSGGSGVNAAVAAGATSEPPTGGAVAGPSIEAAGSLGWAFPLSAYDEPGGSGWFGARTPPKTNGGQGSSNHKGLDLNIGKTIHSVADGTAFLPGFSKTAGNMVRIDHGNGYWTQYFHCSKIVIQPGRVTKGQYIADIGSTGNVSGPHLHFQVHKVPAGGSPSGENAIDPAPFIFGFPSKKNA